MCGRRELSGGDTVGSGRAVVITKSVSAPLALLSAFVSNQTPRAPRRPHLSPPKLVFGL